jgi:hypothetical protein
MENHLTHRSVDIANDKWKNIINHSIWWVLYIFYELSIFYYTAGTIGNIRKNFFYYLCNISLFYVHKYILDDNLIKRKKNYLRLFIFISLEITIYLTIKIAADFVLTGLENSGDLKIEVLKQMAALDLYRCIFFAALATLYWTGLNISRFQKQAAESEIKQLKAERDNLVLETDLAKAQNAYLQQQINPHLLFNSLNFIHNTVYKYSEAAAENILLLAEIMRFTLEGTGPDGKVSLYREIAQLNNLIVINQSRFDYPLNIDYSVSGDTSTCRIIPLVLMTLLENVFKHANLRERQAYARIALSETHLLTFETGNYKSSVSAYGRIQSLGIKNIRLRLDYTYGDHYKLNITDSHDYYQSILTIQL